MDAPKIQYADCKTQFIGKYKFLTVPAVTWGSCNGCAFQTAASRRKYGIDENVCHRIPCVLSVLIESDDEAIEEYEVAVVIARLEGGR